jgi:hypothetical protein
MIEEVWKERSAKKVQQSEGPNGAAAPAKAGVGVG